MQGLALNEIVTIINYEVKMAKGKLLVEESGREVASLQGHVSGYSQLMNYLAAEFSITQIFIEDLGDEPQKVPDMLDTQVFNLELDVKELQETEEWKRLLARVEARTEELKNHLMFSAEKSRDLDVDQGQYKAMTSYNGFFRHVNAVAEMRRERAEEEAKRREAELNFDEKQVG